MSDNSQNYQQSNNEINEQVTHMDVANAFDEKTIEQTKKAFQNSNDIEREQAEQEQAASKAKEQKPEDDQFSSKFAALSRKEKALRAQEKQIEQKIAEFNARMSELNESAQQKPVEEKQPELPLDYRLKKEPLKTLEELGISYEDLTRMVLNDGKMSTDMQLKLMREEVERDYKSKFEQLENRLKEKEIAEEEAKYNGVINNFKKEITDFINTSEKYDLIQANEAHDLVFDVIEEYYKENGRILSTEEAADQIEQFLEEEAVSLYEKSKKIQSRISGSSKPAAQPPRQSPTLSNSLSAQGVQNRADRPLTREESLAQAASLIKWED